VAIAFEATQNPFEANCIGDVPYSASRMKVGKCKTPRRRLYQPNLDLSVEAEERSIANQKFRCNTRCESSHDLIRSAASGVHDGCGIVINISRTPPSSMACS